MRVVRSPAAMHGSVGPGEGCCLSLLSLYNGTYGTVGTAPWYLVRYLRYRRYGTSSSKLRTVLR